VIVQAAESPSISRAFDDIASLLHFTLQSLDLACTLRTNELDLAATNIVLGSYHLKDGAILADFDAIVYQLEQLPGQRQDFLKLDEPRLAMLRAAREVWDYSVENIALLAERGVDRVKYLPFGFHERLRRIDKVSPDIDVLFYGAINARRQAVLRALGRECRTKVVFGVYGEKRDELIGRSKIVLNLHNHPAMIMEQPRVSYLLNNECFVISEESAVNPFEGALTTTPYEELVACCLRYLGDADERDRMARVGFDFLARRPMTDYLRGVLG
jgi:hypothetical protein